MRWTLVVGLVFSLWLCLPARGAMIDFTVEGVVTQVNRSFLPDVSIGDPFTIRYSANPQDHNPDPKRGSYIATKATVEFPNTTYTSQGEGAGGGVGVWLDNPDGTDRVWYVDVLENYWFRLDFVFPAGTLTSDELPLSLPLSSAVSAEFWEYLLFTKVRGPIDSYVPEPASAGFAALVLLLKMSRTPRWRHRKDVLSSCG